MRFAATFIVLLLLLGCNKDKTDPINTDRLEGTWLLAEVLFDPGDGSGEFTPSDSGFSITLRPDNTFEANYNICRVFEEGNRMNGEFTRIAAGEILIACSGQLTNGIQGRIEDGRLLFYYPCVEPCIYRFNKVSDATE